MSSVGSDSAGEEAAAVLEGPTGAWAVDVKKRLIDTSGWSHRAGGYPRPPTIFRVPDDIRNCDRSAYEPQVISIGPYHHRPNSSKQPLQRHKSLCVRHLLSLHRSEQVACELLHRCLARLAALGRRIRQCYSEAEIGLSDQQLAELMLLDGCFIIHLLFADGLLPDGHDDRTASDAEEEDDDADGFERITIDVRDDMIRGQLLGKSWVRKVLKYDLLKLENQIPFFVVEEILKILEIPFSHGSLVHLVKKHFDDLLLPKAPAAPSAPSAGGSKRFFHLLHLFHSCILIPKHSKVPRRVGMSGEKVPPNATELQRVGIKFSKNKNAKSLLDITFKGGILTIPPLPVVDNTNSLFRNLIAFEQLCPFVEGQVTAYVVLMDCLIDTAHDVSILRSHGIIDNMLSTDQAAADLFNNFKNNSPFALDNNYLHDVFFDINSFSKTRRHRWFASLKREYLANPWKTLSVVAAVVLLILTFIQAFFAIYAYVQPPKGNG